MNVITMKYDYIVNIDMLYLENRNNFILSCIISSIRDSVAFL